MKVAETEAADDLPVQTWKAHELLAEAEIYGAQPAGNPANRAGLPPFQLRSAARSEPQHQKFGEALRTWAVLGDSFCVGVLSQGPARRQDRIHRREVQRAPY